MSETCALCHGTIAPSDDTRLLVAHQRPCAAPPPLTPEQARLVIDWFIDDNETFDPTNDVVEAVLALRRIARAK